MAILLAFAPFIGFAVVDRLSGSFAGLVAGTAIAGALLVRDLLKDDGAPKLLDIGSFLLFAGLALYTLVEDPVWSVIDVRLRVDSGLLAITLLSMLVRRPFTLQYAREQVAPEHWDSPRFLKTNQVITGAWTLAFAVMVLADFAMRDRDVVHYGVLATIAALIAAMKFTRWYPQRVARG
jgi:hypothetical protein